MLREAPTGLSSGPAEPRPLLNYWWMNPPTRSATARKRAKIGALGAQRGDDGTNDLIVSQVVRLFSTVTPANVAAIPTGISGQVVQIAPGVRDERVSNLQRRRIRRGAKGQGAVMQCHAVG